MQVSLSETMLWRAFELYRRLDVSRFAASSDGSAHATTDAPIQVHGCCQQHAALLSVWRCSAEHGATRIHVRASISIGMATEGDQRLTAVGC